MISYFLALIVLFGIGVTFLYKHQGKRTLQSLSQDERRRAQDVLSAIPDIVLEVDENKLITWINQPGYAFFGREVVGQEAAFYFQEEPETDRLVQSFFNGHQDVIYLESWQSRQDGEKCLLAWRCRGLKDKKGNVRGALSSARDITKQKQAEEALRESGDRYRQVVKNANEAIFVTQDQAIKFFNPKAKEIYGYTDETPPAVFSFIEAIHPEDRGMVLGRYQKRMQGEDLPHVYPFRIIDRQGKVKWVEINSVLISWAGRPATLNFLNDISERKKTEEKIILAKEEWERTFDSIPDLIAIVDNACRIMRVNRAMADRLSRTPREMIGASCYELIHGLQAPPYSCLKSQVILKGKELSTEFYEPQLGGHFLLTASPLRSLEDNSSAVIHVFRDISDRKQAEEKIIQGAKKLQKIMDGIIQAMALTVEARDPHTAGHQRRVAGLAREIAQEMGFPVDRVEGIHTAGMIHDLGKMSVPAEILSKTTPLTEIEFGLIKVHPQAGYEILKGIEFPWPVALMILQHHERIDGSGYPQGLRNEEILLEARILAVADVVEAIASHRPYRPALGIGAAMEEIEKNRGRLYDPVVADTCLELFRVKKYALD